MFTPLWGTPRAPELPLFGSGGRVVPIEPHIYIYMHGASCWSFLFLPCSSQLHTAVLSFSCKQRAHKCRPDDQRTCIYVQSGKNARELLGIEAPRFLVQSKCAHGGAVNLLAFETNKRLNPPSTLGECPRYFDTLSNAACTNVSMPLLHHSFAVWFSKYFFFTPLLYRTGSRTLTLNVESSV